MTHEQELEDYILQGMAHAIWIHAFIQWATIVEPAPEFPPNSDWADVTPPTPPGALQAAQEIAEGIARLNGLGGTPMAQMFLATRRYVQLRRSETRATEADQAFQFGEEVAMACLGMLDVPEFGQYKLPQMKAMLDDEGDRLSWDEGSTWHPPCDPLAHQNPAGPWPNSSVQSLLFSKDRYTVRQAQRWAQDHGFKYGSVDEGAGGHFIHLRQFPPEPGHPCRTVDFGHGIEARVCSTRNPGR
jgi:hypothetical protein